MDKRYCQRCSTLALVDTTAPDYQPRPCRICGGVQFDAKPALHRQLYYSLTEWDRDFLRVQRIDPDN